jgi:4-hydroxy-2-oxoheptanedioate aldolase
MTDVRQRDPIRARLQSGGLVVGAHIQAASPELVELSAAVGFDFVTIDVEHEAIDDSEVAHLIRAAEAFGVTPIVRTAADPHRILRFLSAGAQGIHAPHCTTPDDVLALVRACRFRPEGERTLWALGRAANYAMGVDDATWTRRANAELLVIAMVEDVEAVRNLEAILATPGLDVVHIGPKDLWQSMGMPDQERVDALIADVVRRVVQTSRVSVSLQFRLGSEMHAHIDAYVQAGVRMLTVSPMDFIRMGAPPLLRGLRERSSEQTR